MVDLAYQNKKIKKRKYKNTLMVKQKRGKKKKKGNGRWLKVIIGIILALIMLGSVLVTIFRI